MVEVEVEGIGVLRTPIVFVATSFTSWHPCLAKGLRNWISRRSPYTVVGDSSAPRPVSRSLRWPFGAERHFHRIGEGVDAGFEQLRASVSNRRSLALPPSST
jgi:hypothetical protein